MRWSVLSAVSTHILLALCFTLLHLHLCRVLPDIVTELMKALDEVNKKDKASHTLFLLPTSLCGYVVSQFAGIAFIYALSKILLRFRRTLSVSPADI